MAVEASIDTPHDFGAKTKKLVIGIDMDNVLTDLLKFTTKIIKEKTGKRLTSEWITSYPWYGDGKQIYPGGYQQLFLDSWKRWYEIFPCEKDIADKVSKIRELAHIYIITASGRYSKPSDRIAWLERYGIQYDGFIQLMQGDDKTMVRLNGIVEDSPEVAKAWNVDVDSQKLNGYHHPYFFLRSWPYNTDFPVVRRNAFRVSGLDGVSDILSREISNDEMSKVS